ncbi:PepSY-associated TM helix [Rhodopseudomonas palustris HaA2]|uniref:PepSY-associated TM helix n=1 Tax=Rhodopseudomonas palustris (strain HaA2) TaxID=316058 RepID=Q2J3Z7_RHOP2|nr:PepSY domain-containing protein [Rhodopseudomonas palustris]ABD04813.1 PepSY-associated TM helix [Rhodopseudomonas palustris HaA2]
MRRITRRLKRWLYLGHRWLGIACCLLFAIWFISGVVMMYVAFPQFDAKERRAALPDLAFSEIRLAPDQAMAAAGLTTYPRELRLAMQDGEPVYRLAGTNRRRQAISAVDGRALGDISPEQALAVARHHPAAVAPALLDIVDRDQWSVTARFDPLRPLFLIGLGDDAGTELYVSQKTGEIVLDTNRHERVWNWLGAIPHWIYLTLLRQDAPLWRQVVMWTSGICLLVAISGIWIGLLRAGLRRRYASGRITPYRGWMAWHHLTGLVAGVLVLTWMASGWLSVNPFELFARRGDSREALQRYAGHDAPTIASTLPARDRPGVVEARFIWVGGAPLMLLAHRDGSQSVADPASGASRTLSPERIFDAAARLLPDATMTLRQRLEEPDAYWYSHHHQRVLPVLRAGFDDAAATWYHLDPSTGEILGRSDRSRRVYRWLFNALHSFDFPVLIAHRPAWDIVVIVLSLAGLVISVSGILLGWRRLRRA